jgi:hypothetical protein
MNTTIEQLRFPTPAGEEILDVTEFATESWVEAKGYLTEHQDVSGKVNVTDFE